MLIYIYIYICILYIIYYIYTPTTNHAGARLDFTAA